MSTAITPAKGKPGPKPGPKYRALRDLTVNGRTIKRGQIVPGAAKWTRVDAWVRARRIELVEE